MVRAEALRLQQLVHELGRQCHWTCLDKELTDKWNDLIRNYPTHKFMQDITWWPFPDVAVIYDGPDMCLVLGSVKSATEITRLGPKINVDIVVTLNADDPKRRGEPEHWSEHFRSKNIVNLRYGGYDKTGVEPGSPEFQAKKQEFLDIWKAMMADLDEVLASKTGKVTILYHCFGGVNRSAAALCAFLIGRRKYSAEDAVRALMSARAGQNYWSNRDYFFDALLAVNDLHQDENPDAKRVCLSSHVAQPNWCNSTSEKGNTCCCPNRVCNLVFFMLLLRCWCLGDIHPLMSHVNITCRPGKQTWFPGFLSTIAADDLHGSKTMSRLGVLRHVRFFTFVKYYRYAYICAGGAHHCDINLKNKRTHKKQT